MTRLRYFRLHESEEASAIKQEKEGAAWVFFVFGF